MGPPFLEKQMYCRDSCAAGAEVFMIKSEKKHFVKKKSDTDFSTTNKNISLKEKAQIFSIHKKDVFFRFLSFQSSKVDFVSYSSHFCFVLA